MRKRASALFLSVCVKMIKMEKNETLEYRPVEEVKPEGNFLKAVCFKPKMAPIICIAIGIAMLLVPNTLVRLLGLFFIAMSVAVIVLVADHKVVDIFDKGVMVYGDNENKTALFIPFEDIKEWSVKHEEGHDVIMFDLGDDRKIYKDSFEADTVFRTLNKLIREKESNYIKVQKAREKSLSIPDALRNIKKSFKK